jgi:broad specificity phosphatase PhoE
LNHLLFVRHAVTADNLAYRFIGRRDTSLHPIGFEQAECLATRLQTQPISYIVSSPLQRAWQTATAIADKQGACPVLQDDRLAEIDLGIMDGLSMFTAYEQYKELIDHALDEHVSDFAFPGGERRSHALRRMMAAIQDIVQRPGTGTVCVVTHGAMLGLWRCHLENHPLGAFQKWQPSHASISEVVFPSTDSPQVVRWSDTAHLPESLTRSIQQVRERLP